MSGGASIRVECVRSLTADAMALLEEYYETVHVVLRDGPETMRGILEDPRSGMWLAYRDDVAAGCVVLKAGTPTSDAGECKRLFVRSAARRSGIGERLMDVLEGAAREAGLTWVYLDTNEAFHASVKLYCRRAYQSCERYNDNPQATLFFRKRVVRLPAEVL